MLSSIGRAAVRRVGGTNRALQSSFLRQRIPVTQASDFISTRWQIALLRAYATDTTTVAKPKPKAKAKTTSTKAKSTSAGTKAKPKAKKKAVKKPAKKKKAAKKPVKKKVVKKKVPLTEEQKLKKEITALKEKALLDQPKGKPKTAWLVVVDEVMKNRGTTPFAELAKQSSAKWQALRPEELEHYNHIANQNKAENELAYKAWVDSYTPDQIRIANNARALLKRRAPSSTRHHPIVDPRLPKRYAVARLHYIKDRFASGDFKGMKAAEAMKIQDKEWAELPASEKKIYEDRSAADLERYKQEYKAAYKRDSSIEKK